MEPIPAWVRRLWDVWDLRLLVLLSFVLQIVLSLLGSRRKYISSQWIIILVWLAYLMADWAATVALGKLSDAQVDDDNGNALRAIWAPLLLLHLGGPDTITAYSLEDNHLWMRHLFGVGVQFSVAVYVILMSWRHSWFSIMSIPALVAGLIKYGERTWVLFSVNRDKSGDIVPFGYVGSGSNLGNNCTLEDKNYVRVLCNAHMIVKEFKKYVEFYDIEINEFELEKSQKPLELDDNSLWNVMEVEMGLMFDLLYTKTPINFRKGGWILRCITFSCTVTVLIGLILQLISTGEDQEKWNKVDIAITVVLLVGALALEIYAIISLYLFSDWAMLWLIKHNRGQQLLQLRKKCSWFFLPKQYRCDMMGQFDLLNHLVRINTVEADQKEGRVLRPFLGIKRWVEEYFKDMLREYVHKTAVTVPSLVINPILRCCQTFKTPLVGERDSAEEFESWPDIFGKSFYSLLFRLHLATEVCYNLEMEWDTQEMASSGSSLSWEDDRKLCRTLSHYMMYLLVSRTSLIPINESNYVVWKNIREFRQRIGGEQEVSAACRHLLETDDSSEFPISGIVVQVRSKQKDKRWKMLKLQWVRVLLLVASKGNRNEHLRQLSQGGEFLTFLWFLVPQYRSIKVRGLPP